MNRSWSGFDTLDETGLVVLGQISDIAVSNLAIVLWLVKGQLFVLTIQVAWLCELTRSQRGGDWTSVHWLLLYRLLVRGHVVLG